MYPDLSYFLHDVFGTNPDNWTSVFKTFGLFLGMSFFFASIVLYKELKRKEEEGFLQPILVDATASKKKLWTDIILNSLIGAFFAFKIPYIVQHFEAFKDDAAGTVFSTKGNLLIGIVGFIVLFGLHYYQSKHALTADQTAAKKQVFPHQRVTDMIFIAAIFGILGARLFSILENLDTFWQDPIGQIFSGSGLTIYGGFILALGALYVYIRRLNIPVLHYLDVLSICYIVGYMVGRLGCHFSGDGDWGIAAAAQPSWWFFPDWLWAYEYPNNVADFYQRGPKLEGCEWKFCTYLDPKVYPTPIWESAVNLIAFGLFWAFRKRLKIAGMLTAIYFIFNGAQRWWIETIRVNDRYEFMGLNWSQAQYIGLAMILIGVFGLFYLLRKEKTAA